ncbi:hypothetical protein PIB30_038588 [Stylosanthes scabra]|uniref:SHSP domain-containing protein n=1 Tax=Stylosanthes scabra TaxID=79078 RepID=A0ABU6QDL5_9FABA|nr:hypothetical protein [Stylosanthes scabra]
MSTNSSFVWTWNDENLKQAKAGLVYQEFEPSFDWIWDDDKGISDRLAVFLPGFKSEEARVEVTSNGVLRLSGERKIGEAIIIRKFEQHLHIPSDTDVKSITTKFESGILYVNLPRFITTSVKPSQQPPPPTPPSSSIPQQQLVRLELFVPYEHQWKQRVMNEPESPPKFAEIFRREPTPPAAGPQQQPQPQPKPEEAPIDAHYQDQQTQRVMDKAPDDAHEPPLTPLEKEKENQEENKDDRNKEEGHKEEEEEKTNNIDVKKVDKEGNSEGRSLGLEKNNNKEGLVEESKKHKSMANLVVVMFLVLLFLLNLNNAINSSSLFGGGGPRIN